jgi:hypothetical protein
VQRETTVQQGSQVKNNTSYATNIWLFLRGFEHIFGRYFWVCVHFG